MAGILLMAGCNDDKSKDDAKPATSAPATAAASPSAPPPASTAAVPGPATSSAASGPPSAAPATTKAGGGSAPQTKEGAIQRYEAVLHALGRGDLDTLCDIAGPAAKQAESEGAGSCRQSFTMMLQMISSAQKTALRDATVDPAKVTMSGTTRVTIPASAVKASMTFGEDELGIQTLEYQKGNWFVVA
ncbi:hypothetical protein ACPA54_37560 [Uniformispora flossi]|uniref:hypothetical protein n=1 Tax=Uniformispora flossi TaxID=3390723 RepID=UPI003C2D5432